MKLYIVPNDIRDRPFEADVKSIGPKYITIQGNYRFKRTLEMPYYSCADSHGYNPALVAYSSKGQYEELKTLNSLKIKLRDKIITLIQQNCDNIDLLKAILSFLEKQI